MIRERRDAGHPPIDYKRMDRLYIRLNNDGGAPVERGRGPYVAITVSDLLAEPQLGLRLLAGEAGQQHRITWAHTSDLPRLWEWVTGGEIMMTNGLSIPADAAGQVELAEELVAAGASVLAIGEKMHAPELTPEFVEACDRLPLPVLNVPYPLPFIAIA